MESKKPWKIDVAVLSIFFTRDECLKQSFASIKKARPRVLLLWQDGPRENHPEDLEGIKRCREIVKDIDWDCEVHEYFNEKNYGCDPSTFYSHKWAFSIVDKCIVLEDDVVPSQSFYYFCKELLDRYENDERINKICGMNHVKNFYCPDSYFFASGGSIGWATWKRVADTWDEKYTFLKDNYNMELIKNKRKDKAYEKYYKTCAVHAKTGKPYWETIQSYSRFLNSQLVIFPAKNLVKNVGLGEDSTHSNISLNCIPKKLREAFYCDAEELDFPLKHPKYVLENVLYKKELFKITGKNNFFVAKMRKIEGLFLRVKYGEFREMLIRKLNKLRK